MGVFALVLYSGFAGAQVTQANFSVTFIYVVFWVGTPVASVLFGDVFRALSPWRTCARAAAALLRVLRRGRPLQPPLRYPQWLGVWPAIAGIVGFAWLELVYIRTRPALDARGAVARLLPGDARRDGAVRRRGVELARRTASACTSTCSPSCRRSCAARTASCTWRRPLSGVTDLEIRSGTVTLICALIGTTTFDGFSNGGIWRTNEPSLQSLFAGLGFNPTPAQELAYSLGLVFCILLIIAVYRVGIFGVRKRQRAL